MEKTKGISLSAALLIVSIIVIAIMGYYIYVSKTTSDKKVKDLEASVSKVEKEKEDLKKQLDTLTKTIEDAKNEKEEDDDADKDNEKTDNDADKDEEKTELKLGNYTVNEVKVTEEDGHSNEECGVTLKKDDKFSFYMGWGATLSGTYKVEDDTLICDATTRAWEDGDPGSRDTDVTLEFEIVDENELKLTKLDVKDTDTEKLIISDGLEVGMTYSIK